MISPRSSCAATGLLG